jgi:Uma2 family endonuclease
MSTAKPRHLLRLEYEKAAEEYLRSLPLEHFMEADTQGRQREITMESLALLHHARPEVQYFNELLVQYPVPERSRPGQVVPDNMVIIWEQPIHPGGSYDVPFQPVGPFMVLEYVSKHSKRKDYEDSFRKYEEQLQVPYYLIFYPDAQELTLYQHNRTRYVTVTPNEHGRYAITELEVEVRLLDGWVRYWYRGELLPLPADLQQSLTEANRRAAQEERLRKEAERRAEEQARRAEEQARRAEEQARRAEEEQRLRTDADRRAEQERQARLALEKRLAELQAQLGQSTPGPPPEV